MENITKTPNEQLNETVRNLFAEAERNALNKMAMWMRYNYIMNQLSKAFESGYTEADINWDAVNERLYSNIGPYDNNMYSSVHSLNELREAREQCIEASIINMAWRKGRCKDCHKEFTLSYSECDFFETKSLALPKRCKCCRDKRKAGGNK